ncbi:MAG: hypothetical protein ACI841_003484 [Planctomycetota bacterium]|jgi:hypothetical protein
MILAMLGESSGHLELFNNATARRDRQLSFR